MADQHRPFTKTLFAAKSTLDTSGALGPGILSQIRELSVYIVFGPGTTAGAITIEGAHDETFAGAWAPLKTVAWQQANRVHHVAVTGVHTVVRARISTAIENGDASAIAVAN